MSLEFFAVVLVAMIVNQDNLDTQRKNWKPHIEYPYTPPKTKKRRVTRTPARPRNL